MLDSISELEKAIKENQSVLAVVCATTTCDTCSEWIPNILLPICNENNILVYRVDLDKEFILTPPPYTPTTYFYVKGHRDPMIILGPESIESIAQKISICLDELNKV